jgi:eukaryotic-like serine/threonine-protein kinase
MAGEHPPARADPEAASIRLTVRHTSAPASTHVFTERTTALIGRARDCDPRVDVDKEISRHHCLFDINPPGLRVRDLGSMNGTFVNGEQIGRRPAGQTPEEGARLVQRERDLLDGDEVRIGRATVQVSVAAAARPRPTRTLIDSDRPGAGGDLDEPADAFPGYELVSVLGRGGQGVVYLARSVSSDELVALKVLRAAGPVTDYARTAFFREIAHTRSLRHPNLVRFRDWGADNGVFHLVSEYCDGGNATGLRGRSGTTDVEVGRAVAVVLQVLDGLHHAHNVRVAGDDGSSDVGLVHRDVKPANILLTGTAATERAKLGDFGLSKAFDRAGLSGHTLTGAIVGTLAFMARPQLVNFRHAKPEVDVWSAAASLYWLLTGHPPRDFTTEKDPCLVVLHDAAVPVRRRRPDVPRELAEALDEALVDNPAITVRSAAELADRLQRFA